MKKDLKEFQKWTDDTLESINSKINDDEKALVNLMVRTINESSAQYLALKNQNDFLTKRENKLQTIEQIYKSGSIDLDELRKIVMEEE